MTERSIGAVGSSNAPQTKEDIARKIADRHPEVSKKDLMAQSLATLKKWAQNPDKIPAMLSESGYYKNKASGGVIRRRGGGIAKRGMGIAK